MSEFGRCTRSARRGSGLLGATKRRDCGTQNMHSARSPWAVPGEPSEPGSIGPLFLPRIRGHRRSGETRDPIISRFSVGLPLARRRPRRTWSDRRSEGGVREGHHGVAGLIRLSGPQTTALVSARRARPHARGPQKSRLGELTIFLATAPSSSSEMGFLDPPNRRGNRADVAGTRRGESGEFPRSVSRRPHAER